MAVFTTNVNYTYNDGNQNSTVHSCSINERKTILS